MNRALHLSEKDKDAIAEGVLALVRYLHENREWQASAHRNRPEATGCGFIGDDVRQYVMKASAT